MSSIASNDGQTGSQQYSYASSGSRSSSNGTATTTTASSSGSGSSSPSEERTTGSKSQSGVVRAGAESEYSVSVDASSNRVPTNGSKRSSVVRGVAGSGSSSMPSSLSGHGVTQKLSKLTKNVVNFTWHKNPTSLRDVLDAVRSRIEHCRLPPLDVVMLRKYILEVVESTYDEDPSTPLPSPFDSKYSGGTVSWSSSPSPGDQGLRRAAPTANAAKTSGTTAVATTRGTVATIHKPPVVQGVPGLLMRSRHVAWYMTVFGKGHCATDGSDPFPTKALHCSYNSGLTLRAQAPVYVASSGGSPMDLSTTTTSSGSGSEAVVDGTATTTSGGKTKNRGRVVSKALRYEAAVFGIIRLHHALTQHEALIMVVLAAVDKREMVLSKMHELLHIAKEDLRDMSKPQTGTAAQSARNVRANHKFIDVFVGDSSTSQSGPSAPERPATAMERGHPPRRMKFIFEHTAAWQARQRYYKLGVLYLLRLLQRVSVEVVEGVCTWRKELSGNYPFVVKGRNYLLLMLREMAELALDQTMCLLFGTGAGKNDTQAPPSTIRLVENGRGFVSTRAGMESVLLPGCLQYHPLLSHMYQLAENSKPPVAPASANVAPFDFGFIEDNGEDAGLTERCEDQSHNNNDNNNDVDDMPGQRKTAAVPSGCLLGRRVYQAEKVLHSELRVQMELLRQQFILCAEGRYRLMLRPIEELNVVHLKSKHRQKEWYWHLRDMLSCLEEGSSAVFKK
ncbi:hypothetical protein TRVL_07101 [Trypanosoma vivax]|nr:hypothetical protein TRVL_07101 [Trypanosoma vivax]